MTLAQWTIFITVIVWVIVDLIIVLRGKDEPTISQTMWALAQKYPAIPFFFGLLFGHFFLQMNNP